MTQEQAVSLLGRELEAAMVAHQEEVYTPKVAKAMGAYLITRGKFRALVRRVLREELPGIVAELGGPCG